MTDVEADQIMSVREPRIIAPDRPSASLNGAVKLVATGLSTWSYRWWYEGAELPGQTNRALVLTNLTPAQAGRYSVVVDTGSVVGTNFTYVRVDPTFKQITEGPVATDQIASFSGHFGDVDGDGLLDLVALSDYWMVDLTGLGDSYGAGPNTRFYHNEGQGKFTAVTDGPWADLRDRAGYSAWADTDNDGDLDLLVGVEDSQDPFLLRNDGSGTFTRLQVNQDWIANRIQVRGASLSWADFDGDGLLDAIVNGRHNFLLRNNGDDTFTALTNSPIHRVPDYLLAQWVDFDHDGDVDVFAGVHVQVASGVAGVYRNDGRGAFTDISERFVSPRLGPGIGAAFGDFDSDGDLDLYFAGWGPPQRFLVNNGHGTFTDWTGAPQTMLNLSNWGLPIWGDYDNDGYLDLFVPQGLSRCRLFRNQGDRNFVEVMTGTPVNDPWGGTCAAWADHDNDGDLDLFLARYQMAGNLFCENLNSGNGNHWLKVRLRGTASNSHAVGAKVTAIATIQGKTTRQMRVITANQVCQELEAHFGLGKATTASRLRIEWPSGRIQLLTNMVADQILTVWEPPALKASLQPNGACVLNIRAEPNRTWQIQASSDLAAWQTLATVTNTTFAFEYTDTGAVGVGNRFYRVGSE